MTYIALHVEKWLYGTTPMELEYDEIACFTYILARAALTGADPPGQIYFFSEDHLAKQLHVPLDLLKRTLEKCEKFKKIKIRSQKSKNIFVLSISNWEKYQHIWMHQKAYRQRQKAKKEAQKKLLEKGTKKHNQNITDYDALADRIGEDKDRIRDEKILDGEDKREVDNNIDPFSPKYQFLSLLKEFSIQYPYPFDEEADGQLYDLAIGNFQNVDLLHETEKKINYWKENPGALRSKGKSPRVQLAEFFQKEEEYQSNGRGNGRI